MTRRGKSNTKRHIFSSVLLMVAIGGAFAGNAVEPVPHKFTDAAVARSGSPGGDTKRARGVAAHTITLAPLENEVTTRERAAALEVGPRPPRIGLPRQLDALKRGSGFAEQMAWVELGNGNKVFAVSVVSPGAVALRAGLLIDAIPENAVVRFFSRKDVSVVEEVTGGEIQQVVKRNIESGDTTEAGRTYWSPIIDGEEISVEVELPRSGPTSSVRISIPTISHFFLTAPELDQIKREMEKSSESCNKDATCLPSPLDSLRDSVAKMMFVEGGSSYICSGTLLNDRAGSGTPYFLSANHCISDQTTASSLVTDWFYSSASCGSSSVDSRRTRLAGGAALLYTSPATDTTLLKLSRPAPGGAVFSGWWPSPPASSSAVVGIHHPSGDLKKTSTGNVVGYVQCSETGSDGKYSCSNSTPDSAAFISVVWRQGITEGGSSGSALWGKHSNGGYYVVGQLRGGSSSCSNPTGKDMYGRFDAAYGSSLHQWLNSTPVTPLPSQPLGTANTGSSNGINVAGAGSGSRGNATISAKLSTAAPEETTYPIYLWANVSGLGTFCAESGVGWVSRSSSSECSANTSASISENSSATISVVSNTDLSSAIFTNTAVYLSVGEPSNGVLIYTIE